MFRFVFVGAALWLLVHSPPAQAGLVLEVVQVSSIDAGPATGPAISSLNLTVGQSAFVQVMIRDTTGVSYNWHPPTSPTGYGLMAFGFKVTGIPNVLVNPGPANSSNIGLVDPETYLYLGSNGSNQPISTNITAGLTFGINMQAVPDADNLNRIGLLNLRLLAVGPGSGTVTIGRMNGGTYNLLGYWDPSNTSNNPTSLVSIENQLFGGIGGNVSLPLNFNVTPVPEPTSFAFFGLAAVGFGIRRLRKK